ncbi:MAG: ABC transporter ATP-binding protein [Bifidobacteriaceae bacterium]|jgi:putative ABC transport system ATP-binding protein|nr:ABC transporter ATP-binding protein [Bifidobacteriaceae bacterium]
MKAAPAPSHNTEPARQTAPAEPIAYARALTKTYGRGEAAVQALRGVDVTFARGELTAIMGPSGSGKSTLMHCLAGLDSPTSGLVVVDGQIVSSMGQRALTKLRRERLGFVFQSFNLVPTLSAAENITLPLDIARRPVDRDWFDAIVGALRLGDRLTHRPGELSGGQSQRVACARALMARPAVVFADEPTGNLDSASSREVLGFLRASVDQLGQSIVIVTHDAGAAGHAHRVLFLSDGQLVDELAEPTRDSVLDRLRALGRQETTTDDAAAALRATLAPASSPAGAIGATAGTAGGAL